MDIYGGNKKCFLFSNYVLLLGSFKEDEIKKEIKIGNELKNNGVNIIPTIEYKIVGQKNELGYSKGYILQPKAKGTWLYTHDMTNSEYKKRLHNIAKMDCNKLDKFISDWITIVKAGLQIDPSKCENFFYSDTNICFIDLNLRNSSKDLKNIFLEIISVLTGLGLKYKGTNINDCIQIITNTACLFLKKGLNLKDIQDVLDSHYGSLLNKFQIGSIITFLNTTLSENAYIIREGRLK